MIDNEKYKDLMAFVWQNGLFDMRELRKHASIISPGFPDKHNPYIFRCAEILRDGKHYVTSVAIHRYSSEWSTLGRNNNSEYDDVMLNIVNDNDRVIYKINGQELPCITIDVSENIINKYIELTSPKIKTICISEGHKMDKVSIKNEFTRLMIERMERKCQDVKDTYSSVHEDWHETFYIEMFGAMGRGNPDDKKRYKSLARNIPYSKLCRESGSHKAIEAMLFGSGGMLDSNYFDEYYIELQALFKTLRVKHSLQALKYDTREITKSARPFNQFTRRIAQLAKLVNSPDLNIKNVVMCKTVSEVEKLFDLGTVDYWKNHFAFDMESPDTKNMIGDSMTKGFLINLIVPIMFAYGDYMDDENMKENAIDLLYQIKYEENRFVTPWIKANFKIENAAHSQALIQLGKEYCGNGRCYKCFLGNKILKQSYLSPNCQQY